MDRGSHQGVCGIKTNWRVFPLILLIVIGVLLFGAGCGGGGGVTLSNVQRQIAALPCPPGVSVELWDLLTAELTDQLEKRASASPLIAGPPLDELSIVDDLTAVEEPLGSVRLRWTYKNTGDYDQNSETNISDLTPIGRHFNKTPASADWNKASVADGDLNHEVNIADITPIGRCYLQTVTEYRIEFNASGAPGSGFAELLSIPIDAGAENANDWLSFDHTYAPGASGYYRVVPYYFAERGIEGMPVYFGANQSPNAVLTADPQAGSTPLVVNFDASASHDPENLALTFEWDWEGDGVFDHQSTTPLQQHEYTEEGEYAPILKATDSKGAAATDQLSVYCHNWVAYDLMDDGAAPIAMQLGGNPCFVYAGDDTEMTGASTICYAQSKVAVPMSTADWDFMTVVVPEQLESGLWVSYDHHDLFELDGRPAIIFWTAYPYYAWYFAHASLTEPSSHLDWQISKVWDSSGQVSMGDNTVVLDNRVYCFVYPSTAPEIWMARSLVDEPLGPDDWEVTLVYLAGGEGAGSSSAHAGYIENKLCFSSTDLNEILPIFGTSATLTPQGPEDWGISYVTDQPAGGGRIVDVGGLPILEYSPMVADGAKPVCLARGLVQLPQGPDDWETSLVLERIESRDQGWLTDFRGGRLILTNDARGTSGKQVLALYPSRPGMTGLGSPWVSQPVNPQGILTAKYVQGIYSDDSMMCIWYDKPPSPGPTPIRFAVAHSPLRY